MLILFTQTTILDGYGDTPEQTMTRRNFEDGYGDNQGQTNTTDI